MVDTRAKCTGLCDEKKRLEEVRRSEERKMRKGVERKEERRGGEEGERDKKITRTR